MLCALKKVASYSFADFDEYHWKFLVIFFPARHVFQFCTGENMMWIDIICLSHNLFKTGIPIYQDCYQGEQQLYSNIATITSEKWE